MVPYDTPDGTQHTVPILGLRADNHYDISVTVSADGADTSDSVPFDTGALPDDFPPLDVTVQDPSMVSPGVTVFPVSRWNPSADGSWGYLIALDEEGQVIWYADHGGSMSDIKLLTDHRLSVLSGEDTATAVDAMGNEQTEWTADDLGLDTIHHEMYELPDGNFAMLTTELRSISGYDGGTSTYDVVGDKVVEVDPNGNIVHDYSMLDLLDPMRTRLGFDQPFWDRAYTSTSGTKDWSHGNAVIYDARDDSFIVSLRHQDWMVKVDRKTGALIWRFGEGGDFTMVGGGDWQYHEHAPELEPNGNILVYDNGNGRTSLGAGEDPFSRVVEFSVDENTMETSVVWEYRNDAPYYSAFVGNADMLPNGNVLITDGGILSDPSKAVGDPTNQKSARVLEVTHEDPAQKVWEVDIHDDATTDPVGYHVYRAIRIDSLYDALD